jgi:hypothetical protein
MRIYLGVTLTELASAVAMGGFGPAPFPAHAVTPSLREWYAHGDLEELEYAATSDAARESLRHLSLDPDAPSRRVVVAADVDDSAVIPDASVGRSIVVVGAAIPMTAVDAVHVDDLEASPVVEAAAGAVAEADAGDQDAAFTVDEALGCELLWYARQEIPDLLA